MPSNLQSLSIVTVTTSVCIVLLLISARLSEGTTFHQERVFNEIKACLKQGGGRLPSPNESFPTSNEIGHYSSTDPYRIIPTMQTTDDKPAYFKKLHLDQYIVLIAQLLTKNTKFDHRFAINATPDDSKINLYFVTCDLSSIIPGFRTSICTYIGYYNAIVCRTDFFNSKYQDIDKINTVYDLTVFRIDSNVQIGPKTRSTLTTSRTVLQQNITTWIIAHEIGHAILHKRYVVGSDVPLHWSTGYNNREKEADDFAAKKIGGDAALVASTGLGVVIGEFIEQEYRLDLRSIHPNIPEDVVRTRFLPTVVPLELYSRPGEMPLLIRAIRMRKALSSAGIEVDETGYYEAVERNVILHEYTHSGSIVPTLAKLIGASLSLLVLLTTLEFWHKSRRV